MKRSKKKKKHDDVRERELKVVGTYLMFNRLFRFSSKGDKKKPVIAKVVAPYEATSKEQLTLAAGQLILIRKKTDTGWWQGEIQGVRWRKSRKATESSLLQ